MLILSESIHRVWKKGNVFSAIFMDVAGVFNNIYHSRLIHNMRKHKIPVEIIKWILSFLSNRTTRMRFNGIMTDFIPTPIGIPQGSPLSPILYRSISEEDIANEVRAMDKLCKGSYLNIIEIFQHERLRDNSVFYYIDMEFYDCNLHRVLYIYMSVIGSKYFYSNTMKCIRHLILIRAIPCPDNISQIMQDNAPCHVAPSVIE